MSCEKWRMVDFALLTSLGSDAVLSPEDFLSLVCVRCVSKMKSHPPPQSRLYYGGRVDLYARNDFFKAEN